MGNHLENRAKLIEALRAELVGPSPQGKEIDCGREVSFTDAATAYSPWRQLGSGEEILQRDRPTKRYGIGVLYPARILIEDETEPRDAPTDHPAAQGLGPEDAGDSLEGPVTEQVLQEIADAGKAVAGSADVESDDFDLTMANCYRPSTLGISFLAEFPRHSSLVVQASGGRYRGKPVKTADRELTWWLRSPVHVKAEFEAERLCSIEGRVESSSLEANAGGGLDVRIEVFSRPHQGRYRLVTVCLVNRSEATASFDESCLFQSELRISVASPDGSSLILPYPGPQTKKTENEERSLELLYRNAQVFAVGHGCAAAWEEQGADRVKSLTAECLPAYETPSITPDITREDGTLLGVPMAELAGLIPEKDGFDALAAVVDLYERWVRDRSAEIPSLEVHHREPAQRHMDGCARAAERMRDGLEYLQQDARARRAFQLANHAVLLQQLRTRREPRRAHFDTKESRIAFSEPYSDPDPVRPLRGRGSWRPFQIAFLLMTLKSVAEGGDRDRRLVELLWFPTGGGKTEAYLGLAAFALFMRRLRDPEDAGVQVLMRYTLRLLTAQQFQRASSLICAMERLRRKGLDELGRAEFSIGIWLGAATTPNSRREALEALRGLVKKDQSAENKFVLTRCPWCGAQMGPVKYDKTAPNQAPSVLGYEPKSGTVVLTCSDSLCEFRGGLPIYVIDDDIYDVRPSLIIGTVDKFAMLAWRPRARSLFGLGEDGQRDGSPPGLIIQDELHLISGPLGSLAGLYEAVIEELCTDRRDGRAVPPKIVSSTATIRRYAQQIKGLFARDEAALFPPPGLEVGDSFFSRFARSPDGRLLPGRIYVGVHAPGLGSMQTAQVRTFAALLQAPYPLPVDERDPWWTLVAFFNSLRELGTTLSLLQSDIPDYLKVLRNRTGSEFREMRRLRHILELTGRMRSEEVPKSISELEIASSSEDGRPVDICLASSIIEVGIDIDRLSLMAVVGQPKTTSQYIQVTGRIGRLWQERPGLVVTIYSPSKPRDRSHYEKFRSYHERLYAQVEPTSVTPFSASTLDRALHAVIACYARQAGDADTASSPYPYPDAVIEHVRQILLARVREVDPEELRNFEQVFARRTGEWRRWGRTRWEGRPTEADVALLRQAGAYVAREHERISWPTPTSMRNVDAECEAEITRLYLHDEEEANA